MAIGKRIRKQRMARGMSINEFCARLGVSRQTVHNWERRGIGVRDFRLTQIAELLDISANELLGIKT